MPFFGHKTRREREWEEVRESAQDDLVALGDDIRSLDVDIQMPDVSAEARQRYEQALEACQFRWPAEARVPHVDDKNIVRIVAWLSTPSVVTGHAAHTSSWRRPRS